MLEIRGLSKSFGGVKATDDVSLDFPDGSLTAVIGPNGAGKSTFFNLITGALLPDAGQILLNGVDMAGPDAAGDRAPRHRPRLPGREHLPVADGRGDDAGHGLRRSAPRRR